MILRTNCKFNDVVEGIILRFGESKLSGTDKLTLSGVVSLLTVIMMVSGAIFFMENRYATSTELRALRCDVVMFNMAEMEMQRTSSDGSLPRDLEMAWNRMDKRWERMCANRRGQ